MALVKTGGGITDIRGSFGGVYFTRDKSGLHCTAKPRRVHQRTSAQNKQRNAFSTARAYSKVNRVVSYNIYRVLTGLHVGIFATVTGPLIPNATGTYIYGGKHNGKDYYKRTDDAWFIWWDGVSVWYITEILGESIGFFWYRTDPNIVGIYGPEPDTHGIATVALFNTDPPFDYQPPKW